MHYALCTVHYCTMHYALCTMHCALLHYALCTMHYALCTMHYALWGVSSCGKLAGGVFACGGDGDG